MKKPFRVLCIDGGGMRGLYTAQLLSILAQRFDSKSKEDSPDFGKAFDLICGTSTGAILACALAAGILIRNVDSLYRKYEIPKIPDTYRNPNYPNVDIAKAECWGVLTLCACDSLSGGIKLRGWRAQPAKHLGKIDIGRYAYETNQS